MSTNNAAHGIALVVGASLEVALIVSVGWYAVLGLGILRLALPSRRRAR